MDLRSIKSSVQARRGVFDARRTAMLAIGSPVRPSTVSPATSASAARLQRSFDSTATSPSAKHAEATTTSVAVTEALAEMTLAQRRADALEGACGTLTRLLADVLEATNHRTANAFGDAPGDIYCVTFGPGALGEWIGLSKLASF